MRNLLFVPGAPVKSDSDLLRAFLGRRISKQIHRLCLIGAHGFSERSFIDWIFPEIRHYYLFEPLPGPVSALQALAARDSRVRVFPFAVSGTNGPCEFHVASNDGESSSLLPMGTHKHLFPHVGVTQTITVQARTLESVLDEHSLAPPDMIIIDVQGAEYNIIASFSRRLLEHALIIYTECSTEEVYTGSQPMSAIDLLLEPRFERVGFAPLTNDTPMHGNAALFGKIGSDRVLG